MKISSPINSGCVVNTMMVVRVIAMCVFLLSCHALEETKNNGHKHEMHKLSNHHQGGNTPRDIKQKRDERSHPNKMTHDSKGPPKARQLNLRLDTAPRKLVNTAPTVIKPVIKISVPIFGRTTVPNIKKEHIEANDKSREAPNITLKSPDNTEKDVRNEIHIEKPMVQQFFEDNDEPIPKVHPKHKQSKIPKDDIEAEHKVVVYQSEFIENDDFDDVNNLNGDQIKSKNEPTRTDKKLNLNVVKNTTEEIPEHSHKHTEHGVTVEIEKPVQSRTTNVSDIEETTLVGGVFSKNQTENNNKTSINVKLEELPRKIEHNKIEPNNTSLIISNHDYEELIERATGYIADTANIRNLEPNTGTNNWNYNYYPCEYNYNDPGTYRIEYNYKMPYDYYNNDGYKPSDSSNFQVIDVKPDKTDRVYRSWKNTEVRIGKGNINSINLDAVNLYRDKCGTKMPYCYEYWPVIGNAYYSNQNMASPYNMYPSYRYEP